MYELRCNNIYWLAAAEDQFCSVRDRADTTVLVVVYWHNQQREGGERRKEIKIHLMERDSETASLKGFSEWL